MSIIYFLAHPINFTSSHHWHFPSAVKKKYEVIKNLIGVANIWFISSLKSNLRPEEMWYAGGVELKSDLSTSRIRDSGASHNHHFWNAAEEEVKDRCHLSFRAGHAGWKMQRFSTSVLVTLAGGGEEGTDRTREGWEDGKRSRGSFFLLCVSNGWRIMARRERAAGLLFYCPVSAVWR